MDDHTGKKVAAGLGYSRRGPNLSSKDPNQAISTLDLLGCSGVLGNVESSETVHSEESKHSRASVRSMATEPTAGSSSKPTPASGDLRRSQEEGKNSRQKTSQRSNFVSGQSEIKDFVATIRTTDGIQTVLPDMKTPESEILQGFSENGTGALGSCTTSSSSKQFKKKNWRRQSHNHANSSTALFQHSVEPNDTNQTSENASQDLDSMSERNRLRNINCTSVSDVSPAGCSSSDSSSERNMEAGSKKFYDGGSSSGGEVMIGSSRGAYSSQEPILYLLQPVIPQASRSPRNCLASEHGGVLIRTSRAPSGGVGLRLPDQGECNSLSVVEPRTSFLLPDAFSGNPSRSSRIELPHNVFERMRSTSETAHSRMISHHEDGSTQISHDCLQDRDDCQHLNMEGITEVLLAVERFEQDEELSNDQLLVSESNPFLTSLSLNDQYRDMRMDIDNMSYEELLALEERMGTVSTALTEVELSRCLKKSIYMPASMKPRVSVHGDGDAKCSICQEDYAFGDEVGKLACKHHHHMACIHQWLRLKNWCPVCKSSVLPF